MEMGKDGYVNDIYCGKDGEGCVVENEQELKFVLKVLFSDFHIMYLSMHAFSINDIIDSMAARFALCLSHWLGEHVEQVVTH